MRKDIDRAIEVGLSSVVGAADAGQNRRLARRCSGVPVGVMAVALAVAAVLGAVAGCRSPGSGSGCGSLPTASCPAPPPRVTSTGKIVQALWQADSLLWPTGVGGLVVGLSPGPHPTVEAVDALTGRPAWTTPLSTSRPQLLGLVAGDGVVIVEVGHDVGTPPGQVSAIVTDEVVLAAASGRQLWTATVSGSTQSPPLVLDGGLVITGDWTGRLSARRAWTGAPVWQRSRPAGCPARRDQTYDQGLVADGALLAVSYQCAGRQVLVQRFVPSTGRLVWQWRSPAVSDWGLSLMAGGVAAAGDVIVLSGQVAGPPYDAGLLRVVPHRYTFPAALGPFETGQLVLALDAATGLPRWYEEGAQMQTLALTSGIVCETVHVGVECRDDVTGAPSRPIVLSGYDEGDAPPTISDGWAGISDGLIGIVDKTNRQVAVAVLSGRGNRTIATARVSVGVAPSDGSNAQPFVVGAGSLPGGRTLFFLRRVDVSGYPLLALAVG